MKWYIWTHIGTRELLIMTIRLAEGLDQQSHLQEMQI